MLLTDEEIEALKLTVYGQHKSAVEIDALRTVLVRMAEVKILEKIGKPVAWMMLNKTHGLDQSLHFAPKADWHITWEAVPLYILPEVKE